MALIVQKYGGTSVGNTDRIKNVAKRVAEYRQRGDKVVVVVSAMSGVIDGLIKLAKDIAPLPSERVLCSPPGYPKPCWPSEPCANSSEGAARNRAAVKSLT